MPTQHELLNAGYGGLLGALTRHGGMIAVAERLGLRLVQKPSGYWNDFANVAGELRAFIAAHHLDASMAGVAVPSAPGKVGVIEAASVWALAWWGVGREVALSVGIWLHILGFFFPLLWWPFFFCGAGRNRKPSSNRTGIP